MCTGPYAPHSGISCAAVYGAATLQCNTLMTLLICPGLVPSALDSHLAGCLVLNYKYRICRG